MPGLKIDVAVLVPQLIERRKARSGQTSLFTIISGHCEDFLRTRVLRPDPFHKLLASRVRAAAQERPLRSQHEGGDRTASLFSSSFAPSRVQSSLARTLRQYLLNRGMAVSERWIFVTADQLTSEVGSPADNLA